MKLRRARERDLSFYAFPPRRRPADRGLVLVRLSMLGIVALGVLVASGTIR